LRTSDQARIAARDEVRWLNRNVLGMGLASLLSDLGHEMATAVLPLFVTTIGAGPAALGVIEGVSDGASTLAKLAGGRIADRPLLRVHVASLCYLVTGLATAAFAAAFTWGGLLAARTVGWFARGARGPSRDNLMVDSVPVSRVSTAFGFERAGDSLGAILGPAAALMLLPVVGFHWLFLLTLIPAVIAAASFLLLVREPRRELRRIDPTHRAWSAAMPRGFRRFLIAVAIFGFGDFAHSMLVLRASQLLDSASAAIALYVLHNAAHTALSYPIGVLGDRFSRSRLLAVGYVGGAALSLGFAVGTSSASSLAGLFALGGFVLACEETLERAIAAQLLPEDVRGTGFGILAATNGIGDLVSSAVVGLLWSLVSPATAFMASALLALSGAGLLLLLL
jgi:MFS family permease